MNTELSRSTAYAESPLYLRSLRHTWTYWARFLWLLVPMFVMDGSATWSLAASISAVQGTVIDVRFLYPSEWGVPHPSGLAYLPDHDQLALLANTDASGRISNKASIVTITPYEDLVSTVTLPFAVDNAMNLAYDDSTNHLLVLDQAASEAFQVPIGSDGLPDAREAIRFDIGHLGLGQPEGMSVDSITRHLLILDSSASAIVIADLDKGFALVSKLDLAYLPGTDLRGLSLHPETRTLFLTSPSQDLLFEVTLFGSHLNTYDLSPLAPIDVWSLAFGPSADLTDAPGTIHLFLADNGASAPLLGRIVEAALSPADNTGETTLRFAVIGDYGRDNEAQARIAALVHGWNPDFVITTGDNNYPDGEASTIDENIGKYFSQYIGNYKGSYGPGSPTNRFWPSLGNHDWRAITCIADHCSGAYLDYFTLPNNERYYAVDLGLVHLFALDSDKGEPDGRRQDSEQAVWLSNQLAASTACYNVVFFHHPPYSSGRHGSSEVMRWPFADWGAQAVLAGHDHLYERLDVDGIPYFVNGAGGSTLYEFKRRPKLPAEAASLVRYNQDNGAMLVTASATGITYQFYSVDGLLIDDYRVDKACATVSSSSTSSATTVTANYSNRESFHPHPFLMVR